MVMTCVVCGTTHTINPERSYHKFPQDEKRKSKWLEAIGKSEIYAQARICSNHFLKSDYHSNEFSVRNNLLSTAVPSANIPFKSKQTPKIITRSQSKKDEYQVEQAPQIQAEIEPQKETEYVPQVDFSNGLDPEAELLLEQEFASDSQIDFDQVLEDDFYFNTSYFEDDCFLMFRQEQILDSSVISCRDITNEEFVISSSDTTNTDDVTTNENAKNNGSLEEELEGNDKIRELIEDTLKDFLIFKPNDKNGSIASEENFNNDNFEESAEEEININSDDNNNNNIEERELEEDIEEEEPPKPRKKIVLELPNKVSFTLRRKNFTSEIHWNNVITYITYKRKMYKKLRNTCFHLKRRVLRLEKLKQAKKKKS